MRDDVVRLAAGTDDAADIVIDVNDAPFIVQPIPALLATLPLLGITLYDEQVETLAHYLDLLLTTNQRMNLTAIRDRELAEVRLLADSLTLVPFIPSSATRLIDVGSGGGIPGFPIAIACPSLDVTLADATGKKVAFLRDTAAALGLGTVHAVQARAEEMGHDPVHREQYDVVVARAVARLATLMEYTLPLLRKGGVGIFPKGSLAQEEVDEAAKALMILGHATVELHDSPLDGTTLVIVHKKARTPHEYPRRIGVPTQSPILGQV